MSYSVRDVNRGRRVNDLRRYVVGPAEAGIEKISFPCLGTGRDLPALGYAEIRTKRMRRVKQDVFERFGVSALRRISVRENHCANVAYDCVRQCVTADTNGKTDAAWLMRREHRVPPHNGTRRGVIGTAIIYCQCRVVQICVQRIQDT